MRSRSPSEECCNPRPRENRSPNHFHQIPKYLRVLHHILNRRNSKLLLDSPGESNNLRLVERMSRLRTLHHEQLRNRPKGKGNRLENRLHLTNDRNYEVLRIRRNERPMNLHRRRLSLARPIVVQECVLVKQLLPE